ncbi:hypothetical protein N305_09392, partial [Manacus vitellinus]
QGSVKVLELAAIRIALGKFSEQPVNIVTDSHYAAGLVSRLERSFLQDVANPHLLFEMRSVWFLVNHRKFDFYIMHTRSHTEMPGPIAEGNREADRAGTFNTIPRVLEQVKLSHSFFHWNARSLKRQFQITLNQARETIMSCPGCQQITPMPPQEGVNPRGLTANEIWQTDITQIAEFGTLKYVHVTVDSHSQYVTATAHTGEKAKDVIRHWLSCFATLGVPKQKKTDNGPAFISEKLRNFLSNWIMSHTTGIPHSPTGQAIVERAHRTLKDMLTKQ